MIEDLEFALDRLGDESRPVRQTNLAALSDVPRSQLPLFREAWAVYSPERRLELMRELVDQAENNIHLNFSAIYRELLFDTDARVRRLAIDGLWEENRPSLVSPLVSLLSKDPAAEVRASAAMALGRFVLLGVLGDIPPEPAEQAEEALRMAWYRAEEVNDVRRRALEGLAYTNTGDVRELIRVAYYDEDPLVRQSAVFAMGRTADRRWARYVLEELANREAAMRFEAAGAAGEMQLTAAVGSLVHLLDDADGTVRQAAASALGQIGGPAAKRALQEAAQSEDEGLAIAAEAALEELTFNAGQINEALFDFSAGDGAEGGDGDEEFALDDLETGDDGTLYDDEEIVDYGEDDVDWLDEADEQEEDW